jgi:hypothetical protein
MLPSVCRLVARRYSPRGLVCPHVPLGAPTATTAAPRFNCCLREFHNTERIPGVSLSMGEKVKIGISWSGCPSRIVFPLRLEAAGCPGWSRPPHPGQPGALPTRWGPGAR